MVIWVSFISVLSKALIVGNSSSSYFDNICKIRKR